MSLDLAVTEIGAGRPLLILHGLFGQGRNWTTIARNLAATHRVIMVDMRNHGASPHSPVMTYPVMAQDIIALVNRMGLKRPAVMGHSMGGKAAMIAALFEPDLFERMIVVDIAPVTYPPHLQAFTRAMLDIDLASLTRRTDADAILAPVVTNPAERSFLLQNLEFAGGQARWRCNLPVLDAAMTEVAGFPDIPVDAEFTGPSLFVRGGASRYVEDRHLDEVAAFFPDAEVVTLEGAGHWPHADVPAAFLDAIGPFVR